MEGIGPPMNADQRRFKNVLSAFIGVHRRLNEEVFIG